MFKVQGLNYIQTILSITLNSSVIPMRPRQQQTPTHLSPLWDLSQRRYHTKNGTAALQPTHTVRQKSATRCKHEDNHQARSATAQPVSVPPTSNNPAR